MGQCYTSKMAERTNLRYGNRYGKPRTFRDILNTALADPELQHVLDDPTLLEPLRDDQGNLVAKEEWQYDPVRTGRRFLDWGVHLLTAPREYGKMRPRNPDLPPHEVPLKGGDDYGVDDIEALPGFRIHTMDGTGHYDEEQRQAANEFFQRERSVLIKGAMLRNAGCHGCDEILRGAKEFCHGTTHSENHRYHRRQDTNEGAGPTEYKRCTMNRPYNLADKRYRDACQK